MLKHANMKFDCAENKKTKLSAGLQPNKLIIVAPAEVNLTGQITSLL